MGTAAGPHASPWVQPEAAASAGPWAPNPSSYPERRAFSTMPGFETETITRAELQALKSGRRRAWMVTLLVLVGAGVGGYYGWKDRDRLTAAATQSENARRALETTQKETQARLDKQSADLAALEQKAKPFLEKAGAGATAREATARLAADLKKALAADKDIAVESGDDRVILSVAQKTLFAGDDAEPGLEGYRVLFRLGKALKASAKDVKDRQALVAAHLAERKLAKQKGKAVLPTIWELSGARASSVARFLVDEAGLLPKQVSATSGPPLRPPRQGQKPAERIEIVLTPAPKP